MSENDHVKDALEYSRHVKNRWTTYQHLGRTITSPKQLKDYLKKDYTTEIVFLLVARAKWHEQSSVLGFCFCRRTWCHHIVLDFAASHPNAIRKAGGEVRGVGLSMLYSLVKFASSIDVNLVWGEATKNSHEFYETALKTALKTPKISDHFFIDGDLYEHCIERHKLFELVVNA